MIGLVSDAFPGGIGHGRVTSVVLDAVLLPVGVAAIALRKSRVFQGQRGLVLAIVAMAMIGANNANGSLAPATYGTYFMLVAVWVGIWYRPWTVLALAPLMTGAYLVPLYLGAPRSPGDVAAVFLVVPITVLAGEIIAHYTERVRRADQARERLLSELSRETVTDELTGVGNRRLGEMLIESLEAGDALTLLDIDHFKDVNDRYGHPEGDRLLGQLGFWLLGSIRERDAAARMGGDEFMIVMRGAGAEGLNIISRQLAEWRQSSPRATISAGVAVHRPKANPQATYAAADRALYEAKHSGGDRAVSLDASDKAA
ncbi:MAG TPA: GGDEF domain-containing protein [Acidimicrobiales bacterium]|nr:GGDEF domain-containing protein [Acidimicrobiales bacterium]